MKILCVFGKYQYGQKERGINTEYFSFIPALESLGHELIFFDSWDKSLYKDYIDLNQKLIEVVAKEDPDIIFSVQFLYEIWLETWDYIRANFKCKTLNWCTDDSWKYKEHSQFFAPHFDLMVTTYDEFLPKYIAQGAKAFLSSWGVPIQWVQKPKKACECQYDVTFVGSAHGDRKAKIQQLEELGIDVKCFGYGWNEGAIDAYEIPKIFNSSIISLNFANSSGENQIKARVFEVTGCGGFLLTENAKNLNKFFRQDEVTLYTDMQDCANKIKYYLEHIEQRDAMVLMSFEVASKKHTYAARLQGILAEIQNTDKKVIESFDYNEVIQKHKKTFLLQVFKELLVIIGRVIYGNEKGKRFARRVMYEFSWRFFKEDTYKSKGLVGRIFYSE